MEKEYILSFSSFYKAAYAADVLEQNGHYATLRKLPPLVAHSCSTGLYLRSDSIEKVRKVLDETEIACRGIYEIQHDEKGTNIYLRI